MAVASIVVSIILALPQVPGNKPPPRIQNPQQLLESMRKYLKNKQKQSLQGRPSIPLELSGLSDALLFLKDQTQPLAPVASHKRVLEIYEKVEGELLILGKLGSGKTTLLLDLALGLIERAERDEKQPIPVIFNLASWAKRRPSITDWLIEELCHTYKLDRQISQRWVNSGEIVPLLDSLDEVPSAYREACIDAINTYRQERRSVQDDNIEPCLQSLLLLFMELMDFMGAGTHHEIGLGSRNLRFAGVAILCHKIAGKTREKIIFQFAFGSRAELNHFRGDWKMVLHHLPYLLASG